MRRRDIVFACVAWGGFLAALVWALSTQSRWVQEYAKPVQVTRPQLEDAERSIPAQPSATGVFGTVSDDTMAAMAKGLRPSKTSPTSTRRQAPQKASPKPTPPEAP